MKTNNKKSKLIERVRLRKCAWSLRRVMKANDMTPQDMADFIGGDVTAEVVEQILRGEYVADDELREAICFWAGGRYDTLGVLLTFGFAVSAMLAAAMLGVSMARREIVPATLWLADMIVHAVLVILAAREV